MKNKEYIPQPIDVSDVVLPRDLAALGEKLASNAHDMWAVKRFKEGWTYGKERDDDNKKHPDLVQYENLSDAEKAYDRDTASGSLKAIHKLGFAVHKVPGGRVLLIGRYNKRFVDKFAKKAENKNLQVIFHKSWNEAKAALKADITNWHAIVFDSEGDKRDKDCRRFMRNVIDELNSIFHSTYNEIPWYILPYQRDEFTDLLITLAVSKDRELKEWGKVVYKEDEIDELMEHIVNVLPNIRNYKMRMMYEEVFDTIDKYFDKSWKTEERFYSLLLPMHYPAEFQRFSPDVFATNLRKVFEQILLVLTKHKFIPDVLKPASYPDPEIRSLKGYGEPNQGYCLSHLIDEKNKWVNDKVKNILKNAKDLLNDESHSTIRDFEKGELFHTITSYALQLADVVIWVGKLIDKTSDELERLQGEICKVEKDAHNNYYCDVCDKCRFGRTQDVADAYNKNAQVILKNVSVNNHCMNKYYLYTADIDVL